MTHSIHTHPVTLLHGARIKKQPFIIHACMAFCPITPSCFGYAHKTLHRIYIFTVRTQTLNDPGAPIRKMFWKQTMPQGFLAPGSKPTGMVTGK